MSLFTDSNVVDLEKLLEVDPEVSTVAVALSKGKDQAALLIDGTPSSICGRAWAECRNKLESALASFSTYYGTAGMQSHLAAVLNYSWYGVGTRAKLRINQIVVTDTYYSNSLSALQQWATFVALRLLYQTASFYFATGKDSKGDRYQQKADHYASEQDRFWRLVLNQGVPFILSYMDSPGSLHGWNAGTWDTSNLSTVSDPDNTNANPQNIRVAITYYDSTVYVSPANPNNGESGPSQKIDYTIPANELLTVNIASLNPPNKNAPPITGVSQSVAPILNADTWQVYTGTQDCGAPLYLQSASIPIGTKAITLPATLATSGPILLFGQVPSPMSNLIMASGIVVRG